MAMKSAIHEMTPYLPLTTEVLRQMATDDVTARGTSIDDLDVTGDYSYDAGPGEVVEAEVVE